MTVQPVNASALYRLLCYVTMNKTVQTSRQCYYATNVMNYKQENIDQNDQKKCMNSISGCTAVQAGNVITTVGTELNVGL